jgi:hypothetical protein
MYKLTQLYKQLKEEEQNAQASQYKIYCDMDGVLTDFEERFDFFTGMSPDEYRTKYGEEKMWNVIDDKVGVPFWAGMKWMSDGRKLWDFLKKYNPPILSAPSKRSESREGKRQWMNKNLPNTKLILSRASDKKNYATKDSILIDDRKKNIDDWINAGGIGILHTSADNTIKELTKLGIKK